MNKKVFRDVFIFPFSYFLISIQTGSKRKQFNHWVIKLYKILMFLKLLSSCIYTCRYYIHVRIAPCKIPAKYSPNNWEKFLKPLNSLLKPVERLGFGTTSRNLNEFFMLSPDKVSESSTPLDPSILIITNN